MTTNSRIVSFELGNGGAPKNAHDPIGGAALISDCASVFEHIFRDEIQICIWNRAPDDIIAHYLEHSVGLAEGECSLGLAEWERSGVIWVTGPRLNAGLIELFVTLSDAQRVGVRMAATKRATCPRFHTDGVGLRLLCTWVGEGTEWLAQEDIVRQRSISPDAIVQRLNTFAVGVFKGDGWPGNCGRGAVHRSPQPRGWRVWVSLDAL